MVYELYRLDQPEAVVYTVHSTSERVAMLDGALAAWQAGDVYLCSQNTLTAVTSKGVLGVRRKAENREKAPLVKRAGADFNKPVRSRKVA